MHYLLLAAFVLGTSAAYAQNAPVRVTGLDFSRGQGRDFVPERSYIVNRGPRLYVYWLDINFQNRSSAPQDFQEIRCVGASDDGIEFKFAYRNQPVGPGQSTQRYFMVLPFVNIAGARCQIGEYPPSRNRAQPGQGSRSAPTR